MTIALRPVDASDRAFLLDLYASTREAELALVPWTPAQKQAFVESQFEAQSQGYAQAFPAAQHSIILKDGIAAGRLYLSREPGGLHILDLTIAPSQRNAGIGSEVLREILAEADQAGKPVRIYVESFNRSLRLFERLGFHVVVEDGFQRLLERPSPASAGG